MPAAEAAAPAPAGAAAAGNGTGKGSKPRHARAFRQECVFIVLGALTAKQRLEVAAGGNFAAVDKSALERAYAKCRERHHDFQEYLQSEEGMQAEPLLRAQRGSVVPDEDAATPETPATPDSGHISADSDAGDDVPVDEQVMQQEAMVVDALMELHAGNAGGADAEPDDAIDAPQHGVPAGDAQAGNEPVAADAQPDGEPAAAAPPPKRRKKAKTAEQKEYDTIKENAKRWTVRFLQTGDINDKPRVKGARLLKMRETLRKIKGMLEKGWIDDTKTQRIFRSVDELQAYDRRMREAAAAEGQEIPGESFEQLKKQLAPSKALGLSNRTIWLHLKASFGMRKRKQRMRRARKDHKVKVC